VESTDGEWVELEQSDGSIRRLWRPDEQPPSPDGTFGTWYVDDGQWEWVSAWTWVAVPEESAASPAPASAPLPVDRPLVSRRFVLGWGAAAAVTALIVVGIAASRDGGSRSTRATAAELAQEIGIAFDRFQIDDQGYLGRTGGLAVIFINQGRETRTFWTTIQAAGPRGVLAVDTIQVQDLKPGETRSMPAFGDDPNLEALAAATFTVTRTDGTPPPLS
jgi:hypothetical protein